jgi:hypothetical protein
MEVTIAREIIKRAKKDDIYDGPIPEDDATAIKEAGELVQMAEQAWASHVRGPEVEAIINIAQSAQNGDGGDDAQPEEETPSDEHAPSESDTDESDDVPEPFQNLDPSLRKTEPWEKYGDDTVENITEGIGIFADEMADDPEAFQDILKNVWAFESAHKNRKRIFKNVIEAWKNSGGKIEEASEEEEAPSGDEPEAVEEEATSADGDVADTGDADASDDAEPEANSEDAKAEVSNDAEEVGEDQKRRSGGVGSGEQQLIAKVEDELKRERADGIPSPPDQMLPELPWEWGDISDVELQNYHMQYSAWAFYKSYQRTRHERVAILARQAADELTHAKRLKIDNYDSHNKEKKVGLIEAEIAQDETIKRWRKMQSKHDRMTLAARQELDALHKMVESLSRLETMRMNAWERARK